MNRRKDLQNEFGVKGRSMGIFQIVNIRNGKQYVAASPTLDSAWQREKFMLDTGSHLNSALQHDYKNQAGADFHFEILAKLELGVDKLDGSKNSAEAKSDAGTEMPGAGNRKSEGEPAKSGEDPARTELSILNRSAVQSYRDALKKLEQQWLDELKPYGPAGYNRPPQEG
ncbi:GIY-YIG nuclease family protein [Paenibacillus sacheonensis]|uniref:GIY-YIG nuclease family protein n=1 Tax=Paenibacillus sacheonensis TaxID=742054 RepID=A0A7X5BXM7_9BACL|nr:GIY-YIG nuclease family protein [Paenibacillus sacheonensis]MBM7565908.1 hypothetical protein [Paenibacillus sacheonensis]NBC68777.1 hypothetical protein [Paenibacillus sacheonensis]